MNHFNSHHEVNTRALENYIQQLHQKEQRKKRESQVLMVLILIGLVGLYYVCTSCHSPSPDYSDYKKEQKDLSIVSKQKSKVTTSVSTKMVSQKRGYSSPIETLNTKQRLTIRGEKEVYTSITFELDSFDEKASYILDFGDGHRQILKTRNVSYLYKQPGKYKVNLKVRFNGKTKNIYSGKLNIGNAIEIAEGAELEI